MKKLLITTIAVAGIFGTPLGLYAQEESNVMSATTALQDVLLNLKQSVDQLSSDNEQLSSRDSALKAQITELQAQLNQSRSQGDRLLQSVQKLQENNPSRAGKITVLQEESDELGRRQEGLDKNVSSLRLSLEEDYQEDQKLLLQLKGLQEAWLKNAPLKPPQPAAWGPHQKEKLKLMKMIDASEQRQEALHQSILKIQHQAPVMQEPQARARQTLLKAQITDLQKQIAAYGSQKDLSASGSARQWDDVQLRQLESQFKALGRNYAQLKGLIDQMSKRAQSVPLTVSQHVEEKKLQDSIEDLKRQGISLRVELDDLRSKLVELDKRKFRLESMIK